jgi:hypothetical protein
VETPGTKVCQANKARGFGCEAICVFFVCHKLIGLARMLHEGNEDQGKYSKQYWSIARRCIAIAMDQGGSTNIGS